MMVPKEKIDDILSRINIADLIGQYVVLKPSGSSLKGLCPFHSEKTPSFVVHPDRGFYKCFGCGEGGSALQFIMKMEKVSFQEALRLLAEMAGVSLSVTPYEKKILSEKDIQRKILAESARFYHETLIDSPMGKKGISYFKQRGFKKSTVIEYKLGFAPFGGDFLIRHLRNLHFTYDQMEKSGVARRSGNEHYDFFRGRIIFPISDGLGRIIALAGRAVTPDSTIKYLNTPESLLFSKGKTVFGLFQAKNAIKKEDKAFLVEGYMDAITMYQEGFQNVVASMGTALTEEQSKTLSRYTRRVIMAYDADGAGSAATVRGIEIFEKSGLYVKVMNIPTGEDPDSILKKKGKDYFAKLAANAQGIIEYKIDKIKAKFNTETPEGKQDFFKELAPILREVQGDVRRAEYVRILSERHKIPQELLHKSVFGAKRPKTLMDESPIQKRKLKLPEEIVLSCLLNNPNLIEICKDYQIDEFCMGKHHYALYKTLMKLDYKNMNIISANDLSSVIMNEDLFKLSIDLSLKEGSGDCNEEQLRIFLREIEHKKIKKQREKSFQEKLAKGTLNYNDPDFIEYIASLQRMKSPRKE